MLLRWPQVTALVSDTAVVSCKQTLADDFSQSGPSMSSPWLDSVVGRGMSASGRTGRGAGRSSYCKRDHDQGNCNLYMYVCMIT